MRLPSDNAGRQPAGRAWGAGEEALSRRAVHAVTAAQGAARVVNTHTHLTEALTELSR